MTPKRLVLAFVARINGHDPDGLHDLMTRDHAFVDALGIRIRGRSVVRVAWAEYFRLVPDYWVRVDEVLRYRDIVALFGAAGGTYLRRPVRTDGAEDCVAGLLTVDEALEVPMRFAMVAAALAASFLAGRLDGARHPAPGATQPTERVIGIGGVFFKAKDPKGLSAWYRDHLGLADRGGSEWSVFEWREREDPTRLASTVWALFQSDTKYFEPSRAPFMVNYRVRNLDRMLTQLRQRGVAVDPKVSDEFNGRFAWLSDPEGNRIELWEPKEGY